MACCRHPSCKNLGSSTCSMRMCGPCCKTKTSTPCSKHKRGLPPQPPPPPPVRPPQILRQSLPQGPRLTQGAFPGARPVLPLHACLGAPPGMALPLGWPPGWQPPFPVGPPPTPLPLGGREASESCAPALEGAEQEGDLLERAPSMEAVGTVSLEERVDREFAAAQEEGRVVDITSPFPAGARLVCVDSARSLAVPLLAGQGLTLGRGLLPNPTPEQCKFVSRRHAFVAWDGAAGALTLKDLGSCNSTYVNGIRVAADSVGVNLAPGDEVRLGGNFVGQKSNEGQGNEVFPAWSWLLVVARLDDGGDHGSDHGSDDGGEKATGAEVAHELELTGATAGEAAAGAQSGDGSEGGEEEGGGNVKDGSCRALKKSSLEQCGRRATGASCFCSGHQNWAERGGLCAGDDPSFVAAARSALASSAAPKKRRAESEVEALQADNAAHDKRPRQTFAPVAYAPAEQSPPAKPRASHTGASQTGGRRCLGCSALIGKSEPHWKVRCLGCYARFKAQQRQQQADDDEYYDKRWYLPRC